MLRLAFVFPGQGSQEVGMGKDLLKNYIEARELFDEANAALRDEDVDLRRICIEGPEEELNKTINLQPAILTISIILYRLLIKNNINPEIVTGHSLGEYSALVASSSLEFKDAVKLVRERGKYMQIAIPLGEGSMAAIISLNRDKIEKTIKRFSKYGVLEVANYNSPYQIVVSGKERAIKELLTLSEGDDQLSIVPLKVSAPFHTSLMIQAKKNLASYLEHTNIKEPKIPIICNVTANYVNNKKDVRNALIEQITNPVKWLGIVKKIKSEGINYFVEVGPGNVLKKLIKQTLPKAKIYSVYDSISLEKVIKKLM